MMIGIYFIFQLLSTIHTHKVGLILNSDNPSIISAIKDVANFTLSNLTDSTEVITEVITKEYSSTYLSKLETMCALLDENVSVIISASSSSTTAIEVEVASQFNIPYISTVATNPYLRTVYRDNVLFLSPSDKYQSQAIFDILQHFNWLEFSILASADDYGIYGILYLEYLATIDSSFNIMSVQRFDVSDDIEQFDITEELQLIKESLVKVIVLNCGGRHGKIIFSDAKNMGLMDEGFVWIVTDDMTGQPENLAYNGSFPSYYKGIIGTVPTYGEDTDRYNEFKDQYIAYGGSSSNLMMSSIMVSDAITVIHQSLSNLNETGWDNTPAVSCYSTNTWNGSETILNSINETTFSGISGEITFDENGESIASSYDIMNFRKDSFLKIGSWTVTNPTSLSLGSDIVYLGGSTTAPTGLSNTLTGVHLRVGIVPEPPIAYKNDSACPSDTTSPHCWYGWNPDIIQKLADDLNFTYEYVEPADGQYGGFDNTTQSWSGMVKDIVDQNTDLTIALSINVERSQYIDFTYSFFENDASFILYAVAVSEFERVHNWALPSFDNMFFFGMPFKTDVWISLFGCIFIIAFLATILSKLSPYGNYGRRSHAKQTCPCSDCLAAIVSLRDGLPDKVEEEDCLEDKVDEEDELEDMSFLNSLWSVSTGLVGQGGETMPKGLSGRFLIFCWWFLVMLIMNAYQANLAANLTIESASVTGIGSLTDLLDQDDYTWGIITGRNLESLMKNEDDKKYGELVKGGVKLTDVQDGFERVQEGGFVFIDETSVLDFTFRDNCTAIQTATGKFSNEWCFGLQKNSPYASLMNQMLLQYREQDWLTDIRDQWYTADTTCTTTAAGSNVRFDLPILSGLFLIFGIGIICSFLLVGLETLYAAHIDSMCSRNDEGFWTCLWHRLCLKGNDIRHDWLGRKKNVSRVDSETNNNAAIEMSNTVEQ